MISNFPSAYNGPGKSKSLKYQHIREPPGDSGMRSCRALKLWDILRSMFDPRPCSITGCAHSALTGLNVCAGHCRDLEAYSKKIVDILVQEKKIVDYDIAGIFLREVDLSGVQITACNLKGVRLYGAVLKRSVLKLVFSDRMEMSGCDFSGSTLQNSVFAGSLVEDCIFEDCDLLQCNFMGVIARRSSFSHSNLYASRFIGGEFDSVTMKDCSLTRTRFNADVRGIDFHSSNLNEARFVEAQR
jgi:uncharacterized protein YjbI with pentapeptide repeats